MNKKKNIDVPSHKNSTLSTKRLGLQCLKVEIVTTILVIGFAFAVFFHYWLGAYEGRGYPFNTFVFDPRAKFSDLFNVLHIVSDFDPYHVKSGYEPGLYFPFMFILLYLLQYVMSNNIFLFFFITTLVGFLVIANYYILGQLGMTKISLLKNTFILALMTHPVLFTLDRGNLESFLFIALGLSIFLFYRRYYYVSAIFLAIAIAMKAYPAIFLVLFLKNKQFKAIALCITSVGMLTLVGLILFPGGMIENFRGLVSGLDYFKQTYVIGNAGVNFSYCLFGVIKVFVQNSQYPIAIPTLASVFSAISTFIFVMVCIIIMLKDFPLWRQLTLIVATLLLFLPVTPSYKVLILYIPLWAFFIDVNISRKNSIIYSILFGLLFIPKEYFSTSIITNPLLLLILLSVALFGKRENV